LQRLPTGLALCGLGDPFCVDWNRGPLVRRLTTARREDPLPRALGLHRRPAGTVLDPTGGFLQDGSVLAALGCQVVAVERHPVIHWLTLDALQRCAAPWTQRLEFELGDGAGRLNAPASFDAVYLDPMFPTVGKGKAAPGKEGQILRALAGPPAASDALLAAALTCARERVVVKRHPHSPALSCARDPSFTIEARRTRFDVYLTSAP